MKKVFGLLLIVIVAIGCGTAEKETNKQRTDLSSLKLEKAVTVAEKQRNDIVEYAMSQGLTNLQFTKSHLGYIIEKEGKETLPLMNNSTLSMNYKMQGIASNAVNEENGFKIVFENIQLSGWKEAINLMPKGGKGKFFLPSYIAYGMAGNHLVEPNEILVLDMELLEATIPDEAEGTNDIPVLSEDF